jgi:Ca2+-binding EF-hand superfamily protein
MKRNSGSQNKQFNPTPYTKPGLSPEEVLEIKYTFDLFDTDQGGSIDTKGTS